MSVEDVNSPPKVKTIDPTSVKPKDDRNELAYWEDKARAAEARRRYEQEMRELARVENQDMQPPEPPFSFKGSVNLGDFDLQEDRRRMESKIEEDRRAHQEMIKKLESERDQYRDQLLTGRIEGIQNALTAQITELQKQLQGGLRKEEKSFVDQLDDIKKVAGVLGLHPPSTDPKADSAHLPPEIQLQMLKMENEEKRADRQFKWEMEQSKREWDLKLKEIERHQQVALAEIMGSKERTNTLAMLPELIGGALARGFMNTQEAPPEQEYQPQDRSEEDQGQQQRYVYTAKKGESAQGDCPNCGSPIAFGPTAKHVECERCGLSIPIRREG